MVKKGTNHSSNSFFSDGWIHLCLLWNKAFGILILCFWDSNSFLFMTWVLRWIQWGSTWFMNKLNGNCWMKALTALKRKWCYLQHYRYILSDYVFLMNLNHSKMIMWTITEKTFFVASFKLTATICLFLYLLKSSTLFQSLWSISQMSVLYFLSILNWASSLPILLMLLCIVSFSSTCIVAATSHNK